MLHALLIQGSNDQAHARVMPGLVPGIHVFAAAKKDVDGRVKPGHDETQHRHFTAIPDYAPLHPGYGGINRHCEE
jgi:hypothetical protein